MAEELNPSRGEREENKNERRKIQELAFFDREDGINKCTVIYENCEFTSNDIPKEIMKRFKNYGIDNPYA